MVLRRDRLSGALRHLGEPREHPDAGLGIRRGRPLQRRGQMTVALRQSSGHRTDTVGAGRPEQFTGDDLEHAARSCRGGEVALDALNGGAHEVSLGIERCRRQDCREITQRRREIVLTLPQRGAQHQHLDRWPLQFPPRRERRLRIAGIAGIAGASADRHILPCQRGRPAEIGRLPEESRTQRADASCRRIVRGVRQLLEHDPVAGWHIRRSAHCEHRQRQQRQQHPRDIHRRLRARPAAPKRTGPPLGGADRRQAGGGVIRSAGPPQASSPPLGGADRRKAGGVVMRSAGPPQASSPPMGGADRRQAGGVVIVT